MSPGPTSSGSAGDGIGSAGDGIRAARARGGAGRWAPVVLMGAMAGAYLSLFPLLPEFQQELGFSTASIGLLGAVGFLAAVVGELLLGPRVDHGHGRSLVVGAVVVMAGSLAAHAFAGELWQFLVLRFAAGAAFGAFVPALNAEAIRSDPMRAGRELGRLQSAELVGLAVGPLLAALASGWFGASWTLVAVGVALAATLPLSRGVGRPSAAVAAPAATGPASARTRRGLPLDLLRLPGVPGAVLLSVAFMIPIGAYDSLWPRFLADLGASSVLIGLSYTVFAIPFAVLATRAGARADRVGGLRAAWSGMAVMLPCLVAYGVLRNPWTVTGLGLFESGGQAYVSVAAAAAVAHAVPLERAGGGQGLARSVGTVVAGLVAAAAGPVYEHGGPAALFVGAAVLTLVAMVAATRARRPEPPGRAAGDVAAGWLPLPERSG